MSGKRSAGSMPGLRAADATWVGTFKSRSIRILQADASGFGNLSDSSEQTELLQQTGRDSAALSHYDGLTGLDSNDQSRIHTHIGPTDAENETSQANRSSYTSAVGEACRTRGSLLSCF
jgi:hypothetical protein